MSKCWFIATLLHIMFVFLLTADYYTFYLCGATANDNINLRKCTLYSPAHSTIYKYVCIILLYDFKAIKIDRKMPLQHVWLMNVKSSQSFDERNKKSF